MELKKRYDFIPSDEEKKRVKAIIDSLCKKLESLRGEFKLFELKPIGSTVKGTFLAGDCDIDIYVVSNDKQKCFELLRKMFPEGHQKKGELLIWNFRFNGYDVDLVCVEPEDNKYDTIAHAEFFKENLTEEQKIEVIKLKALFKSHGVYGAEIGGITGVAIEELVRNLRTAVNVCRWLLLVDPKSAWLQDPVLDRKRNLLASINKKRWKQIKEVCKKFLEGGYIEYRKFTLEDFQQRNRRATIVVFERKRDKAIDYHTANSVASKILRILRGYDEDITGDVDVFVDENIVAVAVDVPEVMSPKKTVCIPIDKKEAIEKFEEKHGLKMEKRGDKMCAEVPRRIILPRALAIMMLINAMKKRGYVFKSLLLPK